MLKELEEKLEKLKIEFDSGITLHRKRIISREINNIKAEISYFKNNGTLDLKIVK
jgi:hypothetical protein